MSRKLKRTVFGYDPAAFEAELRAMQAAHQERVEQLRKQADELERANDTLRREAAAMLAEIRDTPDVAQEVAQQLLEAHLVQTKDVYELQEDLKEVEQKHGEVLEISRLHREDVIRQTLDQLRQVEALIQLKAKEGDRGGSSGL